MKIAFIVNRFPALSETFILNQITGLLDRGHEVDIYAYRRTNEPVLHIDVEKYNLLKRTSYIYASMPSSKTYRLIRGIGHIAKHVQKTPLVVLKSLNFLKFGKHAASFGILYQIIPFLYRGPYDVIHCHFGPLGNRAIILKDVGAIHGQIVTTFRGYDISRYIKQEGEHIYDALFEKGSLFLCVSEQIKDILIKFGCNEHKILVHRSGSHISRSHFCLPKTKTNPKDKLRLLTISRLVEKKGVQYGIQSVSKVLKKYPNIEYKIAGDGVLRKTLQKLITDLNICDNVTLIGWQRQEQITELLHEADILLAPSITGQDGDSEGIPGAIIEALVSGVLVISTRHAGIPEVIQDGETGLLVPERDADALAEKLEYLIEHSELWPEMARKGGKYVEEHYDIDKLNDRLVEIYQEVLSDTLAR